jgi:hypothetical protein
MLLPWGVLHDNDAFSDASLASFLNQPTNGSHFTRQMRQWDTVNDPNREVAHWVSLPV